jgi:hypothetical protein
MNAAVERWQTLGAGIVNRPGLGIVWGAAVLAGSACHFVAALVPHGMPHA